MASTIKVNNIQNQCGANIVNKCSTTITLGASGDNITLAAGATQSGFGRTGTVDWDTTAKTTNFTAVSGNGYFVNTTSGAITVTLPATPSAGDIVAISDYAGTAATNNITIARNGSNFEGATGNGQITINRQSVTLIYVDATQGWVPTGENDSSFQQPLFTIATGGTVTCCGDYKIHTFTGPGTFCVSQVGNGVGGPANVDYIVVAGGGGGGASSTNSGGGGGAGGYRESKCATTSGCWTASPLASSTSLPISATAYPITVGGGGTSGPAGNAGTSGNNSIFSTITSTGGGGGGSQGTPQTDGLSGGSGGGGAYIPSTFASGGAGNTPPVSPPQGNNGGPTAPTGPNAAAGGGGGAGATGGVGPQASGGTGPGGNGVSSSITGSSVTRAGGGGAAAFSQSPSPGGTGGGGNGSPSPQIAGTANTGGGSGGYAVNVGGATGNGGSGIVIIRYKYQ
jgi:hypothetical protein